MPQVVGAAKQWRGALLLGQRPGADLLPYLPPGGRLDDIALLAAEQAAVIADTETLDVLAEQSAEFGRDGNAADRPEALLALSCPASGTALEAAVLVDFAVVGEGPSGGGAGVREGQVSPSRPRQVAAASRERGSYR